MIERADAVEKLEAENESLRQRIAELESVEFKLAIQEKTLTELEKKNRMLFEDGPLSYQSLDVNGCFLDVNETWLQKVGYSREEVIGKRFDCFLAPDSAKNFLTNFPILKSSGKVSGVEFEIMKKDGSTLNMTLMGIIGCDDSGNFQRTHCLLQDLTRERESLKMFNTFFYKNPCPMTVTILPERTFFDVNDAFLNSVGYTRDEVLGKTSAELGFFLDEDSVKKMADQLKTTGSVKKMEMRVRSRTGDVLYGLFSGEVIKIQGQAYFLAAMLGITEIKRLEKELRKSEQKYRQITETSPDWMWSFDVHGNYTYSNVTVESLMGYKPDELIGMNALELVHPDDRQLARAILDDGVKQKRGWRNIVVRQIHRNGTVLTFESSAVPVIGQNEELEGFSGYDRDVTERMMLQAEASKKAELPKLMLENISLPIGVSNGVLQHADYLNQKWTDLFGYALDDMSSVAAWWDLAYPDETYRNQVSSEWNSRIENAIENRSEIEPMITRVRCRDGSDRTIEWHVNSTGDWNVVHGVDLTDHKRMERELRLSEDKFRKLTETAPDWIWEMDLDGRVLYSNPAVEQVTGYKAEELINRMAPEFIHPDNLGDLMTLIGKCIKTRSGWHNQIGYWIHKDGSIRVLEAGGVPLLDENNRVTGFRGIARDISERKKLELERLEVQQKLLHAQKLESLAVMAGGIAHDFNNLLMGIMGNLELAISDRNLDPMIRGRLESALKASERSAELSTKMLIYSGSGAYIPRDIDLKKLLSEMKDELESLIPGSSSLYINVDDNLPLIRGEEGHVRRLVTNLATNAVEALGDLPGHVIISTSSMECDESYLSRSRFKENPVPGKYVCLEVTDTGCGMEEDVIQKLFDPFFTTKFWGRGLGMSEVMGVVKGRGGAIHVESSVGQGTTVRVLFPVASGQVKSTPVPTIGAPSGGVKAASSPHRKTILVIDDEDLVRDMVTERLDFLGYKSITAVDGQHGAEVYKDRLNEIDLVILDFMMPRMNGVEAFSKLLEIDQDVKVILSTGYTEDTVSAMFGDRKPASILHKPYRIEILKQELERILSSDD